MDKNFNFTENEKSISEKWLSADMFRANIDKTKKSYTIIMPPPNITSRLHIGHAFTSTIQDALIRFKRMQGFEALLLPGADHAAIATEAKVVDELKKQGIEKSSLSRAEFMKHIHKWYDFYTPQIVEQFKRMGISCDWSRFAFTMDEQSTRSVKRVFKNLYDKGLIYRGERMINWCPHCRTALSDAEVTFSTQSRYLYEIKYPLADIFPNKSNSDASLTVATTRPETMFGDTAIAVNPSDKRYKHLIGKSVIIPLTDRKIPIIADEYVDMKFGTGALKITPAHDHADNAIGAKHNLPSIRVIDERGHMTGEQYMPAKLLGLDIDTARTETVALLKSNGALFSQKSYSGNIGQCYRCNTAVEPAISKQWFVKMESLARPCITALNNGLTITPKKYEKVYLHWLNNIKDWCISRQLLSGHRIPAYHCECGAVTVTEADDSKPVICKCGKTMTHDPDVLDTWFSSALWPFCTLGYIDNTPDFQYFYPTQTMVTAYDILFFWVIRMVFSGLEHTGKLPFDTVLMHGLVRDIEGRKMSKSLGNGIDPVTVIEKYGTDALRFSLICGTKLDRDPRYSLEKAELARNFINKIWNATKFFLTLSQEKTNFELGILSNELLKNLSLPDKWILTKLNAIIKSTTRKYEKFDFGVAANDLQTFFWSDFCDWYIEASKTSADKTATAAVFGFVLTTFLKLINPIMPFVTEQIYCTELNLGTTLLRVPFPAENKSHNFAREKKYFDRLIEIIQNMRKAKKESTNLEKITIEFTDKSFIAQQEQLRTLIEKLSGVKIEFSQCANPNFVSPIAKLQFHIDAAEVERKIAVRIEQLKSEIARGEKMLANPAFVQKAPAALVAEERTKLAENKALLEAILDK